MKTQGKKIVVVQGAVCKCQYGSLPDRLKVLSHCKEYANDKEGAKKLITTTKEIGPCTFENNSFGVCVKMGGSPPPPCKVNVAEWTDYYDDVRLSNKGYVLVHDSKAICAVAGTPCIEVIHHGQIAEPGMQNFSNIDPELHGQLNPMVDAKDILRDERDAGGVSF